MVFWGLWAEHAVEKSEKREHPDSFVDETKALKLKGRRAWKLLMWGIAVETVVAGMLAARDGWEIKQTAKKVEANNPLNQPVSDISADVIFFSSASNIDDIALDGPQKRLPQYLGIDFLKTNALQNFNPFEMLSSGRISTRQGWESSNGHAFLVVEMHFQLESYLAGKSRQSADYPVNVSDIIKFADSLEIWVPQIKNSTDVTRGHVDLLINGSISKGFEIIPVVNGTNHEFGDCLKMIATNTSSRK